MDWLKWKNGRQATVYRKMLLWQLGSHRLGKFIDGYLLEYPPNAVLPNHRDPVETGRHWRCNVELRGSGKFHCEGAAFRFGPITIFRPDVNTHGMVNGPTKRLVLSLGFRL